MASRKKQAVYAVADEVPRVDYLTAGKRYKVRDSGGVLSFTIVADSGRPILCLWTGCAHLDHLDWRRVTADGGEA